MYHVKKVEPDFQRRMAAVDKVKWRRICWAVWSQGREIPKKKKK